MKLKFSSCLFCIGIVFTSMAQTSDAEAEAIVNLLGVQKKEAISKLVSVTGKDSIAFWKIYNEYHQKNLTTAKQESNYMNKQRWPTAI